MNLRGTDPDTGLQPDSFFDVFVDIGELESEQQARIASDEDLQNQIYTEIVALNLHSSEPNVHYDRYTDTKAIDAVGPHTVDTDTYFPVCCIDNILKEKNYDD